jgi:hypothetical protein
MQRTTEGPFQKESPTIHRTAVEYQHHLTAVAVIVLLAALALLAVAMGGHHVALAMSDRGGYSGDDPYDPATGAHPELSVPVPALVVSNRASYSGDDPYDPATGAHPELSVPVEMRAAK